jgi:cytochrome c peroxidase
MLIRNLTIFTFCTLLLTALCAANVFALSDSEKDLDEELGGLLLANNVHAIQKPDTNPAKVALGRLLFWDKIISGNKNISCGTCHLPEAATVDGLSLPIGEGGAGKMMARIPPKDEMGEAVFVPRNVLDLFNRGEFVTLLWDGRVMTRKDGAFFAPVGGSEQRKSLEMWTPAAFALPEGLDNGLAAQAMFPITSNTEMRGNVHENYFGTLKRWDWNRIWPGFMFRLLEIKEYRDLFEKAYPDVPYEELTFAHAANSIAAFEVEAFTLTDSPFDRYLRGDMAALNSSEKNGALLFYGKAGCAKCHSGKLMTDQIFHNRVIPQIGPGIGADKPPGGLDGTWDQGRGGVTGFSQYYYAFRTPPLRNVEKTGPWMHDGAFSSLEDVVRHELDPLKSAAEYEPFKHLPEQYAKTFRKKQMDTITSLAVQYYQDELAPVSLQENEFNDLIAFLRSLTSPSLYKLVDLVPPKVPSGLPVED